jgi:hypothetical protein
MLWFEFRDHQRRAKPWRVWIVDEMPATHSDAGGLCFRAKREIMIWARLTSRRMIEVVGHEFVHAACAHQSRESEADRGGEEHTCQQAEKAMVPIMASLGAVIPPLPEGWRSLRRRERKAA